MAQNSKREITFSVLIIILGIFFVFKSETQLEISLGLIIIASGFGLSKELRDYGVRLLKTLRQSTYSILENQERRNSIANNQQSSAAEYKIPYEYDAFICHATEDKKDLVSPLAQRLSEEKLKIWYDEFTLTLGDSLRRSIDKGLSKSRYGIVVLSHNFFNKEWPQKELDALVSREDGKEKVILPIWHGITKRDIQKYSPLLADRVAVSSDKGLTTVVNEILRGMKK